jgi:hypothetical protein
MGGPMRGLSIITEVVFLAIIISLIFLVYSIAAPMIYTMQVSSAFDQGKSMMLQLDELIQEVADQRKGGKRSIFVTLGAGTTSLDPVTDTMIWVLDTDAMIVSPRSMQQVGNLIIGSNLNSMAYEGNLSGVDAHVLENQNIRVYIKKIGAPGSPASYETSELLLGIYNKKISKWMPMERLEISIDNSPDSKDGTGYTEIVTPGYALPRGEVLAHIETSYDFKSNYTISFLLESGADFLTIGAES